MESPTTRPIPEQGVATAEEKGAPSTSVPAQTIDADATRNAPHAPELAPGLPTFTMLPGQPAGSVCDIDGNCH